MKTPVLIINQFLEPVGGACILPIDTDEPISQKFEKDQSNLYAKVQFDELVQYNGVTLYLGEIDQTLETCVRIGGGPCTKEVGYKITLKKRSLVIIPPGLWHRWLKPIEV